jgi:hypothetical protein
MMVAIEVVGSYESRVTTRSVCVNIMKPKLYNACVLEYKTIQQPGITPL